MRLARPVRMHGTDGRDVLTILLRDQVKHRPYSLAPVDDKHIFGCLT